MAITKGEWLRSLSQACIDCGGVCFDRNNSIRQENFRKKFPGKMLPSDCAESMHEHESKCLFKK